MCERYVLPTQVAAEREFQPTQAWWKFSQRFNVAATQYVPAIRWQQGQSEAMMMRWGLIPAWAEGLPTNDASSSVDSDRIERSDAYGTPWLHSQRCILPVAGFYAWKLADAGYRQPFFIRLIDRSVFGFAALWDRSEGEDDDVIESVAIIRVPANDLIASMLPSDARMPAILRRKDYDTWLQGTPVQAKAVLQPYPAGRMQADAVSPRINSTAVDDVGLIRRAVR